MLFYEEPLFVLKMVTASVASTPWRTLWKKPCLIFACSMCGAEDLGAHLFALDADKNITKEAIAAVLNRGPDMCRALGNAVPSTCIVGEIRCLLSLDCFLALFGPGPVYSVHVFEEVVLKQKHIADWVWSQRPVPAMSLMDFVCDMDYDTYNLNTYFGYNFSNEKELSRAIWWSPLLSVSPEDLHRTRECAGVMEVVRARLRWSPIRGCVCGRLCGGVSRTIIGKVL
jgi:hypothetical protein